MKSISVLALGFLLLVSCTTKKLYKSTSTNDYEELVSQYYISQEGEVLILAEENHYLLEASPQLLEIANSGIGSTLDLEVSALLDVDLQENIIGQVRLKVLNTPDSLGVVEAQKLGLLKYKKDEKWRGFNRTLNFEVKGTRYLAGDFAIPDSHRVSTSKPYKMKVKVEENKFEEVQRKVLLTPVTVVVDGVSLVLIVASIPFSILIQ